MNLDHVNAIQDTVAKHAADLKWWTIPRLQIPRVEYIVPSGVDAEAALEDIRTRLATNPNFKTKLVVKGSQIRIRIDYMT